MKMNLDEILGIIVYRDGIPHPFGKNKMKPLKELTEDNFHDPCFLKEVVSSDWFKETGYEYNQKNNLRFNAFDMCSKGFTIILNGSSITPSQVENYVYTIQAPQNPSEETKEYLSNLYPHLQRLISNHQALFFGEPYDENGDFAWNEASYDLDDFYQRMNLSINKHSK